MIPRASRIIHGSRFCSALVAADVSVRRGVYGYGWAS